MCSSLHRSYAPCTHTSSSSHKVTGQTYALKTMNKQRIKEMDQKEHVENERTILAMVNHPFVVNLVQTFVSDNDVMALMEAVLGGELFAYLRTVGRLRPKVRQMFVCVSACLCVSSSCLCILVGLCVYVRVFLQ
jgi:serine/threonine protein kinase